MSANTGTVFFICVVPLIIICLQQVPVNGFNLAPQPSVTLKQPLESFVVAKKNRSAYFGYTIVLRTSSIIIGAPRAITALPANRELAETGAIYKYNISTGVLQPYNFDNALNIDNFDYRLKYDANYQWLGAAMDGGANDTDKLVVCAPRLTAELNGVQYMHGVCYWTYNTLFDKPHKSNSWIISPLSLSASKQQNVGGFYYSLGEQGFSVHVTSYGEEFLIGAPGVDGWRGSVIRYNTRTNIATVPDFSGQPLAYTGYAVASGYLRSSEPDQIVYVAARPNAKYALKKGEAYLYTYNPKTPPTIFLILSGDQYGEFFGYTLLVDDVNGDGLDDVLISAPQRSTNGQVDVGAVYIFINQKYWRFKRQLLNSPFKDGGRFGTTITQLGDINLDGYKDIAIGAPFAAGHGAVAIYLGSPHGLRTQPSQILNVSTLVDGMFGHGLSRGVDIDGNGYNDLVVGAPNADAIFVYHAYPVVKINATIRTLLTQITTDEHAIQFEICYNIQTNSTKVQFPELLLQVTVDKKIKRVKINDDSVDMQLVVLADFRPKCQIYNASHVFQPRHIFVPIFFELSYTLNRDATQLVDSAKFCAGCAVVDPAWPTTSRARLQYMHGCKGEICNVDLHVKSIAMPTTLTLGANQSLPVTYAISNTGEKAFDAQLTVTTSLNVNVAKMPVDCAEEVDVQRKVVCKLGNWQAFVDSAELQLIFDISNVVGAQEIVVNATVCSTGHEKTPEDNVIQDTVELYAISNVEIIEINTKEFINVYKEEKLAIVSTTFTLQNHGPSALSDFQLYTTLPVGYIDLRKARNYTFIERIFAKVYMDDYVYPPLQYEIGPAPATAANETNNATRFDTNDIIKLYDLPANRTRFLSCQQDQMGSSQMQLLCAQSQLTLSQLRPGHNVTLLLRYGIQVDVITKLMTNSTEYLVPVCDLWLQSRTEINGEMTVTKYPKPYVLVKIKKQNLLWIYIVAIVGGLIFLVLLTLGLRKAGFFKRQTKEDMEKLFNEKQEKARMRDEIDQCVNAEAEQAELNAS